MSEHELLLRHAERWASEKKKPFDADLVDTALSIRALDDAPANRWPAGSVQHLMLQRWPSHGPAGVPDIPALVACLDTFWRFLRATGRMAGASADPKVLTSEAKAAAKKMAVACENPANFGHAKGLLQFGREQGFNLDEVESLDELNATLQQVVQAWNDQPDEVRMTHPLGGGAPNPFEGEDRDEEFGDEPPRAAAASEIAPFARESRFVRQVVALADWADGKEITTINVLRPAVAREAYDALHLWAWDRELQRATGWREAPANAAEEDARRQEARTSWRSAGDCLALDRLWMPAVSAGLVDVTGGRARRVHADPAADEDWVALAHALGLSLVARTLRPGEVGGVLVLLFSLAEEWRGQPRTLKELKDFYWQATFADRVEPTLWRGVSDNIVAGLVADFDDCRWWQHQFGRLVLTPLGWSFALTLTHALDEGWLGLDDD